MLKYGRFFFNVSPRNFFLKIEVKSEAGSGQLMIYGFIMGWFYHQIALDLIVTSSGDGKCIV